VLSPRDRDRLKVLHEAGRGHITQAQAGAVPVRGGFGIQSRRPRPGGSPPRPRLDRVVQDVRLVVGAGAKRSPRRPPHRGRATHSDRAPRRRHQVCPSWIMSQNWAERNHSAAYTNARMSRPIASPFIGSRFNWSHLERRGLRRHASSEPRLTASKAKATADYQVDQVAGILSAFGLRGV